MKADDTLRQAAEEAARHMELSMRFASHQIAPSTDELSEWHIALAALRAALAAEPVQEPTKMARLLHDTYERLAPSFGYETRADTKQFNEQSTNGRLMVAVCAEVGKILAASPPAIAPGARALVAAQAEDEGLWFRAKTAPEAYLQEALRALHSAVENSPPAVAPPTDSRPIWEQLVEIGKDMPVAPPPSFNPWVANGVISTGLLPDAPPPAVPGDSGQATSDKPGGQLRPFGCALAMCVMQSNFYYSLDDAERAECDELVQRNLDWLKGDSGQATSGVPGKGGK